MIVGFVALRLLPSLFHDIIASARKKNTGKAKPRWCWYYQEYLRALGPLAHCKDDDFMGRLCRRKFLQHTKQRYYKGGECNAS